MSFIRNTDKLVEGLQNKWFTNVRAKSAVQSDLDQLASDISAEASSRAAAISSEQSARESAVSSLDSRLDVLEADPVTKAYVDGEVSDLQGQINNVISNIDAGALDSLTEIVAAFQAADSNLNNAITNLSNSAGSDLQDEIDARIAADNALDARLDILEADPTTKSYVDGIQSALDARLDVLEADPVSKTYVDGAVSSEQSARESADNALDARLDVLEGADSVEGSVAKAEKDAKDYADSIVSAEESARIAAVSAEESARISADNALDGRLDILEGADTVEGSVAKAEKDAKDYTDSQIGNLEGNPDVATFVGALSTSVFNAINTEQTRAETEEGLLDGRLDILEGADSVEGSVAKAEKDAKDYADSIVSAEESARIAAVSAEESARIAAVSAEESARISADNALDARLDVLEGADSVEGSVAKAEKDAKDYTDSQISALVNSAPAVLDTLKELADALGNDENFSTTIAGQISGLDGRLDTLEGGELVSGSILNILKQSKDYTDAEVSSEQSARISADNALDARLDVLEGADSVEGSVAKAEKDAKDYADSIVSAEESARIAAVSAEESARISADNALDARLDVLEGADSVEGSVAKAEKDAKDYADSIVSAEESARISADNALDARLDVLEADPTTKSYVDGIQSALDLRLDVLEADPTTKSYVDGIQSALDARLDVLEGADSVEGSVAKAEKDAKDYADSLDSAMDSRVDVLEADPTTKTYVDQKLGPVTSVSSNLSLSSQSVLLCDVSGGTVTLTLPQASSAGTQRRFVIKDSGSASGSSYIRIQCFGSEEIDGDSYYDITAPYESVTVFTDGSAWYIV